MHLERKKRRLESIEAYAACYCATKACSCNCNVCVCVCQQSNPDQKSYEFSHNNVSTGFTNNVLVAQTSTEKMQL